MPDRKLIDKLRTRQVSFAFMFGPPRFIRREEASEVHGKICDALGYDDFAFQYTTSQADVPPQKQGFMMTCERREGRGVCKIRIDNTSIAHPMRLLMEYMWPPSPQHVTEVLDTASTAVFKELKGQWQKVLAEVRLCTQCDVRDQNSLAFIRQRLIGLPAEWVDSLGKPLTFAGVQFEVGSSPPDDDSLSGPKRKLSIEVLRDEPQCLYVELLCQWPQIASITDNASQMQRTIDISKIRQITEKPSKYVDEATEFLKCRLGDVGRTGSTKS